jgi:hypothetical protein
MRRFSGVSTAFVTAPAVRVDARECLLFLQTPLGYVAGAYGTQKGSLGTLVAQVDHGTLTVDNRSGLGYTRA